MSRNKVKKVSIAEASRVVEEGLQISDANRLNGLQGLSRFRISKAKMQTRESQRMQTKYGSNEARVQQLNNKLEANENYISGLRMEANRATVETEQVDERSWVAKGRVYDRRGCPITGAKVSLFAANGKPIKQVAATISDAKGRYRLVYQASDEELSKVTPSATGENAAGVRINTNVTGASDNQGSSSGAAVNSERYQQSVFIRAVDRQDDSLCTDSTLLVPKLGQCNYRDLIFDTDLSHQLVSDIDKDRRSSRYLGNASTLELHDLKNEKTSCQIDEMRADRCVRFKSIKEAESLGYDFCAYCFSKAKSKR